MMRKHVTNTIWFLAILVGSYALLAESHQRGYRQGVQAMMMHVEAILNAGECEVGR